MVNLTAASNAMEKVIKKAKKKQCHTISESYRYFVEHLNQRRPCGLCIEIMKHPIFLPITSPSCPISSASFILLSPTASQVTRFIKQVPDKRGIKLLTVLHTVEYQ